MMSNRTHCSVPKRIRHETFLVFRNHMDPIWKRDWPDMAELEWDIINKALDMMGRYPGFRFAVEQTVVVDGYLRAYPDKRKLLLKRIKQGRFEVVGGAWTLIDLNMVLGESMARNFLVGLDYARQALDIDVKIGCIADAFGLPGQMPQVLHEFGMDCTLSGRTVGFDPIPAKAKGLPVRCDNHPILWTGIDGSTVLNGQWSLGTGAGWYEYWSTQRCVELVRNSIQRHVGRFPVSTCQILSEEVPPKRLLFEALVQEFQSHSGIKLTAGNYHQYYAKFKKLIWKGTAKVPKFKGEFNPVFTGCYTSRSKIKQANTRLQAALLNTDALIALLRTNRIRSRGRSTNAAWRDLILNQFHDALCGCNSVQAFEDIMRRYQGIEEQIQQCRQKALSELGLRGRRPVLFNPLPYARSGIADFAAGKGRVLVNDQDGDQILLGDRVFAAIPKTSPLGMSSINTNPKASIPRLKKDKTSVLENEFYQIRVGSKGVQAILPKNKGLPHLRGVIGALQVEEDIGGPWTSKLTGKVRSCLQDVKKPVVQTSAFLQRAVIKGNLKGTAWDKELKCSWEQEVRLWKGTDQVDFIYRIHWQGTGSTLRAVFPVPLRVQRADYETPFAVLSRATYKPEPYAPFNDNKGGEWPAVRFVSVSEGNKGASMVHFGSHAVRWEPGRYLVSLLRSPSSLNECGRIDVDNGVIPEPTIQEKGRHEYRLSLKLHQGNWVKAGILQWAEQMHHSFMPIHAGELPHNVELIAPKNVGYSTLKTAEDGRGIVLRIFEGAGRKSRCRIRTPWAQKAWLCNMKEDKKQLLRVKNSEVSIALDRFKIGTVYLAF